MDSVIQQSLDEGDEVGVSWKTKSDAVIQLPQHSRFSLEAHSHDNVPNLPPADTRAGSGRENQPNNKRMDNAKTVDSSSVKSGETPVCTSSSSPVSLAENEPGKPPLLKEEEHLAKADLHVRRDCYSTVATFVAGGVAGAASRTLTAPLDRIKLILQEGHLVQAQGKSACRGSKHPSLLHIARVIKADGGWKAFWRGNLVNCFKAGPEFAIVFSLRRYYSSLYEDCIDRETERIEAAQRQAKENGQFDGEMCSHRFAIESGASVFMPPLNHFMCLSQVPRLVVNFLIGAGAGIGAQSVLYPMEVIKTRLCVSKTVEFKGGVSQIARNAYQQGGFREFYRGFVPNMTGILIYRGLEMGLYSSAQQSIMIYRMQWMGMSRHESALSTAEIGLVGLVASAISQTVSYPLNVVRTRLQTQGSNGRHRHYTGMSDCFVKMVRSKGISSLFSGLTANYLKAIPASMITFIVFEKMQQLLLGDD